ncbi:MAG: hypothetical protein PHV23_01170 [Candidatus Gracilibacteria bacterium]|nr:hypothetical protein [Candidatus Gracilibacteria bacterium]
MKKLLFKISLIVLIFIIFVQIGSFIFNKYFIKNNTVKNYEIPSKETFLKNKDKYNDIIKYININNITDIYSNIDKMIIGFASDDGKYSYCTGKKEEILQKLELYKKEYSEVNQIDCTKLYESMSYLNIDNIKIDHNNEKFNSINNNSNYLIKIYLKNAYYIRNKQDIYIYNKSGWNISNENNEIVIDNSNTIKKIDNNWVLDNVLINNIE